MEVWKNIEGYEGYQVSNLGNVKSFIKGEPRILRQSEHKGYLVVSLNGKYKVVHRLVASSFIDNEENKPLVDHINGDRLNNKVNNLRWASFSENAKNKNHKGQYHFQTFTESEIKDEIWVKTNVINKNDVFVSNLGRIKYFKKYGKSARFQKEVIKDFGAHTTYPSFQYQSNDGGYHRIKVHILIWSTFNGPVPKNMQVNHIDGDKSNCRLSNLDLLTPSENIKHNHTNNLIKKCLFFTKERIDDILCDYYINNIPQDSLIPKHRIAAVDVIPILNGTHRSIMYTEEQTKLTQNYKKFIEYHRIHKDVTFIHCDEIYKHRLNGLTYKKIGELYNLTESSIRMSLKKYNKYKELKYIISLIQNEYTS